MKIAFSTLGCPDWTFDDMLSTAKDLGYNAIEVRGIEKEVFAPFARHFKEKHIEHTIQKLKDKNLEISCLATGACVGDSTHPETVLGEAVVYTDLAERLGVKFIRVMVTNKPYPEETDLDKAIVIYQKICDYAKSKGVIPLIETNGVLADTKVMKDFINKVDRENSGVLWDVHHPYRYFGESPEDTMANIGEYIKYIHVKDSVMEDGKVKYKMMGKGDVPVVKAINLLKEAGYDSFVTLEWTKRWNPDLEEPGIVFSHFAHYIKSVCRI